VTQTLSIANQFRRVAAHEISNFNTFDASNATRFAAGACGDSGNITPSVDGCYLFGCMHADQGGDFTIAAGTNIAWALRENYQHANGPAATEDFVQGSRGAVNAQFTEGSCTLWRIYYIMAFRPTSPWIAPQSGQWLQQTQKSRPAGGVLHFIDHEMRAAILRELRAAREWLEGAVN
jgi:hypothetical protein